MKKLLVLVALTMVMFTGCGSEKNTEVVDVKESTPAVVTESGTVVAPTDFVPSTNGAGAAARERDLLLKRVTHSLVEEYTPVAMEAILESYSLNGLDEGVVFTLVQGLCLEIRADIIEEMKVLDEVTEELIIETMTARLEDEVSLEAAIALAETDMQTLGITRIGDETPVATATPAPVVPEEPSKVEYRDTVDADVTEWLANYETRLPDTLDNVTIIGVCLNDSNNAIVEVYFTDSTGTGYTCTSYGLQLCKPDFAEKFSLPGCHLVVYNG